MKNESLIASMIRVKDIDIEKWITNGINNVSGGYTNKTFEY